MKILQRNLNRSTFVVWEMKRNVSAVRLIVATRSSGPPASQPVSCLTRLSAYLCHLVEGLFCFVRSLFCLPKQTTKHRRLESKHHRRNSGSDSRRTGKDFPKYSALGSILSGHKWWPLPAGYDVVTFLTQWGKFASNFVAISSLVVKLLQKCQVW